MRKLFRMRLWLALLAILWVTWGYLPGKETRGATAKGAGTITGVVRFVGEPPKLEKVPVTSDTARCGKERVPKALIIGANKGVQYAVISLTGIRSMPGKPPKRPELDQVDCEFVPRVVIIPVGSTLTVFNSDDFLHTFHTSSTRNRPLNRAQPGIRKILTERFRYPETIAVTCSRHPWMRAWIVVAEHPYYAVTDDTGSFTIGDVPAGSYQLKVWHETLGETARDVVVKPKAETKVTFELTK